METADESLLFSVLSERPGMSEAALAKLSALSRTRPKIPEGTIIVPEFTEEEEELKKYISQHLPAEFDYLFMSVKKLSEIDPDKWEAHFKATMRDQDDMKMWMRLFEGKTLAEIETFEKFVG